MMTPLTPPSPQMMAVLCSVAQPAPAADEGAAPEFIHLLPAGTWRGVDGRGPYETGDAKKLIAASLQEGRKLAIDVNHAIDHFSGTGQRAPAVGWIVAMEARTNGIWGKVEWTKEGQELVGGRKYAFISPVFNALKGKPHRVVQLLRASLTNDPNLTLTALHERENGEPAMDEELRGLLGLDDDADQAAILSAVKTLCEAKPDPAQYVPIAVFQATAKELFRVNNGVTLEKAQQAVEKAIQEQQLFPFMREWATELCTVNKPAFDGFCERMSKPIKALFGPSQLAGRAMMETETPQHGEIEKTLGLSADDVAKYGRKDTH